MNKTEYVILDGIKCYDPKGANQFEDYPEFGYDVGIELNKLNFWERSRLRIIKNQLKYIKCRFDCINLLEIGCGDGSVIRAIEDVIKKPSNLRGSELHLKALRTAISKSRNSNIEFIQLNALDMPFEDEFNIVCAFDVLEHIDDDARAISEISRSLIKDGVLLVTVPQHKFLWSSLDDLVFHKRRYSRTQLITRLQDKGFQIEYSTSFVSTLLPVMFISRFLSRKGIKNSRKQFSGMVTFSPLIDKVLEGFMWVDEFFIRKRISIPFGGSLLVVARKACK